jgi:hypothetical protein
MPRTRFRFTLALPVAPAETAVRNLETDDVNLLVERIS